MQDVTELFGSPEFARMRVVEDAMEQAADLALEALKDMAFSVPVIFEGEEPYEPWLTDMDAQGELIAMLPSTGLVRLFKKFKALRDEKLLMGVHSDFTRAKFRREEITAWLQAKGYKQARYFAPKKKPDEEAHQAAIDRLQARADHFQFHFEESKAEIARLQSELEQARDNHSTDDLPNDRDKLLRHIGALALLLAEKSGTFRVGSKPNALQIAEAVGELMDETQDMNRRGLGSSYIRASISEGLRLLQK